MSESTYDYVFECSALQQQVPGRDILVTQWRGTEAVSQLYRFDITVGIRDATLELEKLLDQPATLRLRYPDGSTGRWHGILTQCSEHGHDESYDYYRLTLEPRLARLGLQRWSDIYLDKPLDSLIEDLLKMARLTERYSGDEEPYDYRIRVSAADLVPMRRAFTCQFEESCLNFLMRKLEFYGVYFWFEQGKDRESVVFGNTADQQPAQAVEAIHYPKGALDPDVRRVVITRMDRRASMQPARVSLRALNDHDNTDKDLLSEADVTGLPQQWGTVQSVADHFSVREGNGDGTTGVSGEVLAKWRAQEVTCQTLNTSGVARTPGVRAGRFLAVSEYHVQSKPLQYYVVSVEHEGTQTLEVSPTTDEPSYRARFVALPRWRDQQYESEPIQFRPARVTPVPRISRLVTGFVEYEDRKKPKRFAQPDKQGRYKVRLPFVKKPHDPYKNSAWLRHSTPYAAGASDSGLKEAGLHLPLREGTEVLIAFLNEDPDLPVIVGSLPNIESPSVVNTDNAQDHVLRTPGGSALTIKDGGGGSDSNITDDSQISLSTPVAKSSLTLGTIAVPAEKEGDPAVSQNGFKLTSDVNGEIFAGKYLLIEVPGHYRVAAGGTERDTLSNFLGSEASLAPGVKAGQSGGVVFENFMGAKFSTAEQATTELTVGAAASSFMGLKMESTFALGMSIQYSKMKDINLREKDYTFNGANWVAKSFKQRVMSKSSVSAEESTETLKYDVSAHQTYSVGSPQISMETVAGGASLKLAVADATLQSLNDTKVEGAIVKVNGLATADVQGGASALKLGVAADLNSPGGVRLNGGTQTTIIAVLIRIG